MVLTSRKQGRRLGSIDKIDNGTPGGICAELSKGTSESRAGESVGREIEVPREYRAESIVYYPLKYGLVTYQGLVDGTVSIHTLFRAKKQAEFMEWIQSKSVPETKQEEVEYFE